MHNKHIFTKDSLLNFYEKWANNLYTQKFINYIIIVFVIDALITCFGLYLGFNEKSVLVQALFKQPYAVDSLALGAFLLIVIKLLSLIPLQYMLDSKNAKMRLITFNIYFMMFMIMVLWTVENLYILGGSL